MGLNQQMKSGTEIAIKRNYSRKEYYENAKGYLINPVQKVITDVYKRQVTKDGKQIQDEDTFTVTCLATSKHMKAYPADENIAVSYTHLDVYKRQVYFTAVGMIDIPTEQEILAMMEEMQKNPQQFRFIA